MPRRGLASSSVLRRMNGRQRLALLQPDLADIAIEYRQHLDVELAVPRARGESRHAIALNPCAFTEPNAGEGWLGISSELSRCAKCACAKAE